MKYANILIGMLIIVLFTSVASAAKCTNNQFWVTQNETGAGWLEQCKGVTITERGTVVAATSSVYSGAANYDATGDYLELNNTNGTSQATATAWVNLTSYSASQSTILVKCDSGGAHQSDLNMYISPAGHLMCGMETVAKDMSTVLSTGNWYFIACRHNATGWTGWVNSTVTYAADVTAAVDSLDIYTIGALGTLAHANFRLIGQADEVTLWSVGLTDTQVTNIRDYNNPDGSSPGVNIATTVLSSPATNDHDNNFTATFVNTWYVANYTTACTLYANSTASGTNSTAVVNATAYSITNDTLAGEGLYTWYVGCLLNDSTWANSTTRTFYLDSTAPTISIHSPSNAGLYYYYDTITKNGTFADNIGLFNCSQDIYYPNGTLADTDNLSCSGLSINWANQTFIATELGTWSANYSAVDSHTANKNVIEAIINGESIKFRNKENNKRFESGAIVYTSEKATFVPSFIEGSDRIKFTYTITNKNAQKNWVIDIPFVSECPIYQINGTPYYNHLVTCDSWIDYNDIQSDGWSVQIQRINETAINQHFTKSFPKAEKTVVIDPATGGLNFGSTLTTFTILVDSQLLVNTTAFYQSIVGYFSANYSNITTGALISGAYCRATIIDPFGASTTRNFTESSTYMGNYTPTYLGTYTYSVTCNNLTTWYPQTATGSFMVTGAPPTTTYTISPATSEYESGTACYNSSIMSHYKKQYFCTAGGCEIVDITNYEACPYGCIGKTCVRSAFADLNIWWAIGFTALLLFLLYGRSSIGKVAGKFIRW